MKIPFSPPDIRETDILEVSKALRSGWITTGPRTKEFEDAIAKYVNTPKAVCLASATSCLEMALRILGIGEGDEVITSAYTFTSSASVITHVGAKIVLVDTEPDTYLMDYDKLEAAITERTRAIIPVELAGVVCDYDRIFEIVEKKKSLFKPKTKIQEKLGRIAIVSDAAHALGAKYKDKMCGEIADFTAFSFHAVKNLTTAEGGALVWNSIEGISDKDIYRELMILTLHGQSKDALEKSQLGGWEYDILKPAYKCNMTDVMAAVGLSQLKRYSDTLKRRQQLVDRYNEAFENFPIQVIQTPEVSKNSSKHLYFVRVNGIDEQRRNEIIMEMSHFGVAANVHYKPLPMYTAYRDMGFDIKDYPNAYNQYKNEITLPLNTRMTDEEQECVIDCFSKVLGLTPNPKKRRGLKPFEKKIWLSSPTMHGEEMTYVQEAFATNWMSTVGENIDEVERLVAGKVGRKYCVGLSAGTAALHLAIKLAAEELYGQADPIRGCLAGKKVFCSDMTFDATVNPVAYEGGEAIFIDSEYETWNIDPVALEKAFSMYPDVKLVVLAHLYGTPAKMDEIKAVCEAHGALIVEDAAESFGATYKGIQTGSFGTPSGVLSTNGNKIITGSCGGLLLTDDLEMANKVRKWSTQSREDAPWYQHEEMGYNYRMSNVIAGVIRGQIPYLEEHIASKKAIYERYKKGLSDLPVDMNPYLACSEPNFWLSCCTIRPEAMCHQVRSDRDVLYRTEPGKTCPTEILDKLMEYNAEGRPIWKPMHMQPIYQNHPFITATGNGRAKSNAYIDEGVSSNVGKDIFERGLCLPSDNKMTAEEQDIIIELIHQCFE